MKYKFPCNCEFEMLETNPPEGVQPYLDLDIENLNYDCPAVWKLLSSGKTKGIFQLETGLGKSWTKKLKPETLEDISALGSILRPGSLANLDERGISVTQHFVSRKNKQEEVKPYHPVIDLILSKTYNLLIYQEQAMAIAVAVAGFTEQEADILRRAIGKKIAEEMAKCKVMFIDGAKKAGIISEQQADEVFGWIEKSQRYSFNKSHAYSYGLTGYDCAYIKAHFPLAFFTSWLLNSKHESHPQDEVFELVNDAKLFDIEIQPPDLRSLEPDFHNDRKVVKFGLSNIKGVGDNTLIKITESINRINRIYNDFGNGEFGSWNWYQILTRLSSHLSPSVFIKFIEAGALSWLQIPRQLMIAEFKVWNDLTEKEQKWMITNAYKHKDLVSLLKDGGKAKKVGGASSNKNRTSFIESQIYLLENPTSSLNDSPHWVSFKEEDLLGISLTCSKIDSCDISEVNCTCKEFLAGRTGYIMLGVNIQSVNEIKTKKGKSPGSKMGRLIVSDGTCCLDDVVCFPEQWKEYKDVLLENNNVIIQVDRDFKDKTSTSAHIKKAWQAVDN